MSNEQLLITSYELIWGIVLSAVATFKSLIGVDTHVLGLAQS